MALKGQIRRLISRAVRPYGYEIVDRALLYEGQLAPDEGRPVERSRLPEGAAAYLTDTHPKLVDLRNRYAACDPAVTAPLVWTADLVSGDHLQWFRGDHAYVWQSREPNLDVRGHTIATYYVKSIDTRGWLESLTEDTLFGAHTFQIAGRTVSRDLLDSIVEMYFLERHLQLTAGAPRRVLDIGAGYGRLAYRATQGWPAIAEYLCVDAVPASTFISEYYLRFRRSEARVVPLDEIDRTLAARPVDIAVNVHSFSECRLEAIDWWLALLEKHRVRHLMIVPNAAPQDGGRSLLTTDLKDFMPIVTRRGYRLIAREPKYLDPMVQDLGLNPTHHFLFER
jgi:SAM-dependent methyltransferase